MAKTLALSPQSQNLKNQILRETELTISSKSWSWSRIFSPISDNKKNTPFGKLYYCKHINRNNYSAIKNLLHARGLSSFSAASLPTVSPSHNPLCSICYRFCFSSVSLLPLRRSCSSSFWVSMMSSQAHIDDGSNPTSQVSFKTVKCVIKGREQGVFYRNWTVENASQLGLKGWVRNKRDGCVEALFSGKADVVDEMLERCRRGPPDAMVTALNVSTCNEDPGAGFERKPTV